MHAKIKAVIAEPYRGYSRRGAEPPHRAGGVAKVGGWVGERGGGVEAGVKAGREAGREPEASRYSHADLSNGAAVPVASRVDVREPVVVP